MKIIMTLVLLYVFLFQLGCDEVKISDQDVYENKRTKDSFVNIIWPESTGE